MFLFRLFGSETLPWMYFAPDDDGGGDSNSDDENTDDKSGDKSEDEGEPYDKERAMRTINRLRDQVKGLKTTASQVTQLEAKLRQFEDKDKSEVDKLKSDLESTTSKINTVAERAKKRLLRARNEIANTRVQSEAIALGANAELVAQLIKLDEVEWETDDDDDDDDLPVIGKPANIDKLVKGLIDKYPQLKVATENTGDTKKKGVPPSSDQKKGDTGQDTSNTNQANTQAMNYQRSIF